MVQSLKRRVGVKKAMEKKMEIERRKNEWEKQSVMN
jgi:hypothetical protein